MPMRVFFGPKLRSLIEKGYYRDFPNAYDQTLVMVNGVCGFCTFPALINVLVDLLRFFHLVLFDWGLAIDFWVCLAVYGLLSLAAKPGRNE